VLKREWLKCSAPSGTISKGEKLSDPAITGTVFDICAYQAKQQTARRSAVRTFKRPRIEVLRLIARGYSTKQIAARFEPVSSN
jgi:DNA-binding NarL/FixJ family response regulator